MKKILLLYIPVIHQGYLELFKRRCEEVEGLLVVGQSLIDIFFDLHKEIRAIDPVIAASIIEIAGLFKKVEVLEEGTVADFSPEEIITTSEVVTEKLIAKYFPSATVTFDNAFLRWDERSVFSQSSVNFDRISTDPADLAIIKEIAEEGEKSADWWRRVGVGIVRNGEIIMKHHNHHVPHWQVQYINGDPRDFIKAGEYSEVATAHHAEASLIAAAAKHGIALEGLSLYTTVFPCPACAKQVAAAGIKKVYFAAGHASLDGESIMKIHGIELIKVMDPEITEE